MIGLKSRGKRYTYLCVPCRHAAKLVGGGTCPTCGTAMRCMGTRWRPPRRKDAAAWKLLESGAWHTERRKVRGAGAPNPGYAFASRPKDSVPRTPRLRTSHQQRDDALVALAGGASPESVYAHNVDARALLAQDDRTPLDARVLLLEDKDAFVRAMALAAFPGELPMAWQLRARRDRSADVRRVLASRSETAARILARLVSDKDTGVRVAAARHPNTRAHDLLVVPLAEIPTPRYPDLVANASVSGQGRVASSILRQLGQADPQLSARDGLRVVVAALDAA